MKQFLLYLATLFVLLSSCKKDNDDDNPPAATFKLVYRSSTNGASTNFELYTKEGDNNPAKLSNSSGFNCWFPRVSPNKQKIIFFRTPVSAGATFNPAEAELWSINATGGGETKLVAKNTNGWTEMATASWSPDGSKIILSAKKSTGDLRWHLFTINADGTSPVQITSRSAYYIAPAFSPDGSKIAVAATPGPTFHLDSLEIFIMNATGANETRYTFNTVSDGQPAWTPTGGDVLFATGIGANRFAIREMKPDGSSQRTLFSDAYSNYAPRVNGAGDFVFFIRYAPGVSLYPQVSCVQRNGTNLVNVTSGNSAFDDDMDIIN